MINLSLDVQVVQNICVRTFVTTIVVAMRMYKDSQKVLITYADLMMTVSQEEQLLTLRL